MKRIWRWLFVISTATVLILLFTPDNEFEIVTRTTAIELQVDNLATIEDSSYLVNEARQIQINETAKKELLTTPEVLLAYYTDQYQVDYELSYSIIACESQFDQFAQNPNSSAEGYWQMLNSTWKTTMERMGLPTSTEKTAMPISIEAGVWLLSKDGTVHWNESKQCWEGQAMKTSSEG